MDRYYLTEGDYHTFIEMKNEYLRRKLKRVELEEYNDERNDK